MTQEGKVDIVLMTIKTQVHCDKHNKRWSIYTVIRKESQEFLCIECAKPYLQEDGLVIVTNGERIG